MNKRLDSTELLFMNYLNDNERELINSLELEVINKGENYSLTKLWDYDVLIGGIGSYSMPANPIRNPFRGGYAREMFRPLQYVRCSMEILDINYTTRNTIRDIGLHLEFVLKYILKWNSNFGNIRYNKLTLGALNRKLYDRRLIDYSTYNTLNTVVKIYNHSKHRVNMDEERDSSFTIGDSFVFYIICRKIATSTLEPYYYKIYHDMSDIINRFHINFNLLC